MIKVLRDTSKNPDFRSLTKLLDDDLNERYGNLQAQYDQLNNVEKLETVLIGYLDDIPAGCGCFRVIDESTVEIKRMFVKPEFRGSGIATMILSGLEAWAIEKGISRSVLETGIKQPEAIRFYTRLGYTETDIYGPYMESENSICMGKQLKK